MKLSKNKFNIYSSLSSSKMRRKYGLFTVEGEKGIRDSLNFYLLEALICIEGFSTDLPVSPDKIFHVSESEMKKLSNLSSLPSILAVFSLPAEITDNVYLCDFGKRYLVVDGVQDPGNFGTIIRTCHWFGLDTVFASRNTVDLFNPKTIQSTMGSFAHVKVIYCDLETLFESNPEIPVYGLLLEGRNIYDAHLSAGGFIVMGNEGNGISKELRYKISDPLTIPPGGDDHSESLNVAVAAGITLAIFAQRC